MGVNERSLELVDVKPGDVVATQFAAYEHFSIVSDKKGLDGRLMLISATRRTKTVKEEPWSTVTEGRATRLVRHCEDETKSFRILGKARANINNWDYSIAFKNCEHFVSFVINGELSSKQVKYGLTSGALGVTALAVSDLLNSTKSKGVVYVGVGLLLASAGVYYARHR